jgi:hypothetical protein
MGFLGVFFGGGGGGENMGKSLVFVFGGPPEFEE